MQSFYASIEKGVNPELRNKLIVVAVDPADVSHSSILTKITLASS
ncbi:hypothetical protein ABEX29_10675 [Brevibacillus porteri]